MNQQAKPLRVLMTRDASNTDALPKVALRLQELRKDKHRREAEVGAVDVAARTVELSFSSEVEYPRYWGIEVLGHDATEVDLSRLQNKAPLLWMHNWEDQRGVVESVRIDGDRKGRAVVRLSKSPAGEQLLQDMADGIISKVSVGYSIDGIKLVEERDGVDVYRVTSWQPYEISMVSVPADDTVGVGRSRTQEKPQEETHADPAENSKHQQSTRTVPQPKGTQLMNIKVLRNAAGHLVRAEVDEAGNIVKELEVLERAGEGHQAAQTRGADAERARVKAISDLGRQYGNTDLAMQFIAEGKTAEEFQRELLHKFAEQRSNRPLNEQARDANIGMSDKEVRQFSIMRAIRALADPRDTKARDAAAFEFEASRAAAEQYGKSPKGIIIPNDVLTRAAFGQGGGGSVGAGSNLVATNLLAGSFIDLLRHRTWVMKRARTLAGLVGNVDIPRQNATGQVYWVGEGGAPTPSTPGIDQVAFSPKTAGAYTDITRRLLLQSTPDAEAIVRDDLLAIMAREIDRVAIYGTGGGTQPTGLKNIAGLTAIAFAAPGLPSYAEMVQMETDVSLADADVGNMSYAFGAGMRGHFKTTLKFPGVNGSMPIWESGNTVNGYATDVSNQIAAGEAYFGNWMDLVIAMWSGLELTVDPYALSTSGGLRLIALQDIDVNVRHIQSFVAGA